MNRKINPVDLPADFQVNIDTVRFSVKDVELALDGVTTAIITSAAGEYLHTITNRKEVEGKSPRHKLQVRYKTLTDSKVGELFVEGSPFAFRYGQNVFSSADIREACIPTLRELSQTLQFTANKETRKAWEDGMIELHRVDLAVNFSLESEAQVRQALKQLAHQIAALPCQSSLHVRYAALVPRSAKKYMITAYAKGAQMRLKTAGNHQEDAFERLVEECQTVLRIEVRLLRRELKDLELTFARDWEANTAKRLFAAYLQKLPVHKVTFGPLSVDDLQQIDERMRPVLALHMHGIDWRPIYSPRTRARHKAYFSAQGIDLNAPHQKRPSISLRDLLSRKRAIMDTPRWLISAGMAPRQKPRCAKR
jgi:hypothetical protein